jgi:hypothetical protein
MTMTIVMSMVAGFTILTFMFVWSCRDYALDHCKTYKVAFKARWKDLLAGKTLYQEAFVPLSAVWFITAAFGMRWCSFPSHALNVSIPVIALICYWYTQWRYLLRLWDSMKFTPV